MPASRRLIPKGLTLCLLASGTAHAQQPPAEAALWNCVSVDDGREWECTGNPDAGAPSAGTAVETPPPVAASPAAPTAPPAPPAATSMTPITPSPKRSRKALSRAADLFSRTPSAWECQGEGDRWVCQGNPRAPRGGNGNNAYVAAYPDAYPAPTEAAAPAAPYAFLDWYPNPGGVAPLDHCDGRYVEPPLLASTPGLGPDEQPTYVQAGRTTTRDGKQTLLQGGVYLRKGDTQLRSQSALIDHEADQAQLEGLVQLRQPGTLMLGENAHFDLANDISQLDSARFVFHEHHIRGRADRIRRLANGNIIVTNGSYTRCEPGNDSWTLNSSLIRLDKQSGIGSADHATLRISGVPVAYLPFIYFPIDDRRQSGFLTPSFSHSRDNGTDIALPYYLNLAPNYDDTLTPRYISKRGLMLENEFRYLGRPGQFDLSLAYLPNDDLRDDDRWLLGLDHSGRFAPGWSTSIDYTAVSDNDYFDELDTSLNISKETHLNRRASITYAAADWSASLLTQGYQTISSTASAPYRKLPELKVKGAPATGLDDLNLNYAAELTRFDRDASGFSGLARATGERLYLEAGVQRPFRWPWAFVTPTVKLTHASYQLDGVPAGNDDAPTRTVPVVSLDSGLYLDRDSFWGGNHYVHTLEPRLYYLYVPFEDQSQLPNFDSGELTFSYSQLFRDNRFSGRDRVGDTHQVTLGLTSRLLADDGGELVRASIGQIQYLEDREVRLSAGAPTLTTERSNIAAEALWNLNDRLRLTADAEWTDRFELNTKRNLKLAYRSDIDHQLNLAYRFTNRSLEQTDLSAIWPLSPHWSLLARWLADLRNDEALDQVLGLEYENCCWRTRVLYRRWVDDDTTERDNNGLFLQVTLKGLGTTDTQARGDRGAKPREFLDEITGFKEREDYDN